MGPSHGGAVVGEVVGAAGGPEDTGGAEQEDEACERCCDDQYTMFLPL